jgi:hypothetical protein
MDRVISVRTRLHLRSRTKGKAADAQDCANKAQIIWLSQSRHCRRVRTRSPSNLPVQRSRINDTCGTVSRWMFDAIVDGLALYAASYYAICICPVDYAIFINPVNRSPKSRTSAERVSVNPH